MHSKAEEPSSPAAWPGAAGSETGYRSPRELRRPSKLLSLLGWSGTPGTQKENPVRPVSLSSRGTFMATHIQDGNSGLLNLYLKTDLVNCTDPAQHRERRSLQDPEVRQLLCC